MKAPKKLTPLSILTGILLAGTFVMPSCASLENAPAAMSCGHEGKVPVSSAEKTRSFWSRDQAYIVSCGVTYPRCNIEKIDFEIDSDLIKKGMPERIAKDRHVGTMTLSRTGKDCWDGNSHQAQGNGYFKFAPELAISWTEVTYRCSDPSCTVAQVEIDPYTITSATGFLIKDWKECKEVPACDAK